MQETICKDWKRMMHVRRTHTSARAHTHTHTHTHSHTHTQLYTDRHTHTHTDTHTERERERERERDRKSIPLYSAPFWHEEHISIHSLNIHVFLTSLKKPPVGTKMRILFFPYHHLHYSFFKWTLEETVFFLMILFYPYHHLHYSFLKWTRRDCVCLDTFFPLSSPTLFIFKMDSGRDCD